MKTTLSHKLMNHHRECAARWLERANTSEFTGSTYMTWHKQDLQRMAYYAQNVADQLGLPRRGIPA